VANAGHGSAPDIAGRGIANPASLMLSTATIIVAGIPAAIYERYIGATDDSTEISLWIWLAGTGILALPAAANLFQFGL
jgi:hypothetical protein